MSRRIRKKIRAGRGRFALPCSGGQLGGDLRPDRVNDALDRAFAFVHGGGDLPDGQALDQKGEDGFLGRIFDAV